MKDIKGVELKVGQEVIVAGSNIAKANCPILRRGVITNLVEGKSVTIKYAASGRTSIIDRYIYMINERICVIS